MAQRTLCAWIPRRARAGKPLVAEFVILGNPRHVHMLHVRIEAHADTELVDRIAASIGVPANVEWLAVDALSRAAYKPRRGLDVQGTDLPVTAD